MVQIKNIQHQYKVYWDQEESWTGDPNPFPHDREVGSEKEAIEFAKDLYNDEIVVANTIEAIHYYRKCGEKNWQKETINWK